MRACILLAAGAAFLAPGSAAASVTTFGGSFATSCYEAAEAHRADSDAWRACENALATEPLSREERAGTFVNRGILYLTTGRYDRAALDFAEAAKLDPNQAEIYVNQAVIAYQTSKPADARDLASRALALGTRKPAVAHFVRGIANEDLGQIKAAYSDLNRAAQLAPGWSEPRKELARYRVR